MNILFVGDIFARPGRRVLEKLLPIIKKQHSINFTIANCENAAGGFGVTPAIADELLNLGIDVMTSGNHIWSNGDIAEYLGKTNRLIRPLNYPKGNPGRGFSIIKTESGHKVCVVNLSGRVFMGSMDCPFKAIDEVLPSIKEDTKIIVVDIHAEATSEKKALGFYLDGRVSFVVGTHTHIQTADEQILPGGAAYITDVGMTGPHDSVIGVKKEIIIQKFLYQRSQRFEPSTDGIRINAAVVAVDEESGKATSIVRLNQAIETE